MKDTTDRAKAQDLIEAERPLGLAIPKAATENDNPSEIEFICTVLVVTYNHRPYIKIALESILEQRTKYKYKIHIFDDASTDGTTDVVRAYAKKYPEIITVFIAEQNQGAQANIWNAYNSVDTRYCAILEGDDFWCDFNKLEMQIEALETYADCIFCAHNTQTMNRGDRYRKIEDKKLFVIAELLGKDGIFTAENFTKLYDGYINHVNSRVIRMSRIELDSLKDKETFLYDNAQFFYLLSKGKMYYINRVMSMYVQTGTGTFSRDNAYNKVRLHISRMMQMDKEIFHLYEKIVMEHIYSFIGYWIWLDNLAADTGGISADTKGESKPEYVEAPVPDMIESEENRQESQENVTESKVEAPIPDMIENEEKRQESQETVTESKAWRRTKDVIKAIVPPFITVAIWKFRHRKQTN